MNNDFQSKINKAERELAIWNTFTMMCVVMFFMAVFLLSLLVLSNLSASQKPALDPAKEPIKVGEGFFSPIKVGDTVGIKEVEKGRYKLLIDWRQIGSKVVDIGKDWIALQDPGNMITRIPITSITSIVDMTKTIEEKK